MRKQLTLMLLLSSLIAFAQTANRSLAHTDYEAKINRLEKTIQSLQAENKKQKTALRNLTTWTFNANLKLDSINNQVAKNTNSIKETASQLGLQIGRTEQTTQEKLAYFGQSLSRNSWYMILGGTIALLCSLLVYWLVNKKQAADRSNAETQLNSAKRSIEEEQVQINTKLAELYNGQMELLKQERKHTTDQTPVDHSLPLKVADEIVKMQMNLAHMDTKVRGHKQLTIAVRNVVDNFKANGYEISDLLNKPYKEGMNLQATMEPDPSLNEGDQIIKRVIKPEIFFKNKVIQHAQVIVAYGE